MLACYPGHERAFQFDIDHARDLPPRLVITKIGIVSPELEECSFLEREVPCKPTVNYVLKYEHPRLASRTHLSLRLGYIGLIEREHDTEVDPALGRIAVILKFENLCAWWS